MLTPLAADGYVFHIVEEERVKSIRNSFYYKKHFTESASIPDLKPPKIGLYIVGFGADHINGIGIGVNTGTPQTQSARIKIKKLVEFPETNISDVIPDDVAGAATKKKIAAQHKVKIPRNYFNIILNRIVENHPEKELPIQKLIDIANGIDFDKDIAKAAIFAQQQDALRSAIECSGVKFPSYEDAWELDIYDESKTYLDGFFSGEEKMTEDDIMIHDQRFFPDFVSDDSYHVKTNVFRDEKSEIIVSMANRNAIEDVLGVDLVYYNEEHESFTLVQYKRMSRAKKGKTFAYYPNSDGNYEGDMSLMQAHTDTIAQYEIDALGQDRNFYYDDYRIFGSPFFFKFANSIQFEPFHNKVIQGYYVSFDMWKSLVEERKRIGKTLVASYNTVSKYIGVNAFCALLKMGLVGSRRCSVEEITNVMAECIRGNRSVVFAYKPTVARDYSEDDL